MASYNLNIDLTSLYDAGRIKVTNKQGKIVDCVVIPIEKNHLYVNESGRVYLSAAMFEKTNKETKEPEIDKYGQSHSLRLSLPKEVREQLSDDDKKRIPYIGNARPMQSSGNNEPVVDYGTYSQGAAQSNYADDIPDDDFPL